MQLLDLTSRKVLLAFSLLVSLTTVLLLSTTVPAGAAPGKTPVAYFKVVVKGVQKVTQSAHHKPENECDISDNSSLTERIVFKSAPKTMVAYDFTGQANPSLIGTDGRNVLTAPATVTRHYTPRIVAPPASPQCGENDGTGESEEPKSDCGTKKVSDFGVELDFDSQKKGGLVLLGGEHDDPFENCAALQSAFGFPNLLAKGEGGKQIVGDLPKDELFDAGIGQIIVLGGGTKKIEQESVSSKTTLEWDVSFRRIAGPK